MLKSRETNFNLSNKMTIVAYFYDQHFSCLEGISNTTRSACLCDYFG